VKSITRSSSDPLPPVPAGKHSYDLRRKKICEQLQMSEVFAPRGYVDATVNGGPTGQMKLSYDQYGRCFQASNLRHHVERCDVKFRQNMILCPDSTIRRKRMVYLSHVLAQCGLHEKAVRPLWRLLRVGYVIRLSNFKRLVKTVAMTCDHSHGFVRNLGAPANGLLLKPRILRDAQPFVIKGVKVPRWTYKPLYRDMDSKLIGLD